MVLHFVLRVNNKAIAGVHIRRLERLTPDRDTYTYEVTSQYRGEEHTGEFEHNHSDGALVCLRKALEVVS